MDRRNESADDTWARTDVRVDELRQRNHDDDWASWRRLVIDAVKAGRKTQDEVSALKARETKFARQTAQEELVRRVVELERQDKDRRDMKKTAIRWLAKIATIAVAWGLGKFGH